MALGLIGCKSYSLEMQKEKIGSSYGEGGQGSGQGSRKSKIGWELTKSGCHVRSSALLYNNIYQ